MTPSDTDLQQLSDRLLELPFLAEFWDTKALHRADLVGVWRAVNILKRADEAEAEDTLRAARTLGLFLPRFPPRMALYQLFDLPIPAPFSPSPSLLKYLIHVSAPWLENPLDPPTKKLRANLKKMHDRSLRLLRCYERQDQRCVDNDGIEVRIFEEQIAQLLEPLDARDVLRFFGSIPL